MQHLHSTWTPVLAGLLEGVGRSDVGPDSDSSLGRSQDHLRSLPLPVRVSSAFERYTIRSTCKAPAPDQILLQYEENYQLQIWSAEQFRVFRLRVWGSASELRNVPKVYLEASRQQVVLPALQGPSVRRKAGDVWRYFATRWSRAIWQRASHFPQW